LFQQAMEGQLLPCESSFPGSHDWLNYSTLSCLGILLLHPFSPLLSAPPHLTPSSSFFHTPFCRWATTSVTVMPESSQPRTHSNLSQMTRVDPSDGPDSDNMVEPPYYENMRTVSIPTKSGTEVALRSHHQSDDRPSTSGLSSRPSSRDGELDHEDAKIIQDCYVSPSTANFDVKPSKFVKPPTEPELGPAFTFGKRTSPANAQSNSQSSQPTQSSQGVPPNSFEKSNQEHQVSARSAHQESSLALVSQGLGKMFSRLGPWLTLNTQAPVDFQKDVQPQRSPLFQDSADARLQKASSNSRGRSSTPQSSGRQHLQGPKQSRRKK
jgi:hypothetical protein